MKLICRPSKLTGNVHIPGSKSHTIRAVAIAALAQGHSTIRNPLESADTDAAVKAYSALGAEIDIKPAEWHVQGIGGRILEPSSDIDVGNSGTTLRILLGSSTLIQKGKALLTGDAQIQGRPAGPLAQSLNDLGANVKSLNENGYAPFEVRGTLRGGETTIECVTSQYLTSLLLCTPLAEDDTAIHVPLLNEKPYVGITLDWLRNQGIRLDYNENLSEFRVPGGQSFEPVNRRIPGDFSSATFFLVAGALGENRIVCNGLDYTDTQGDKAVIDYLKELGAELTIDPDAISVAAGPLKGCEIDLNATPDALPMLAVAACFATGETRLINVPQARIKETDRIAVMRIELEKMGATVSELEDGLVVQGGELVGADVDGHGDHRVVMALAIAGTLATGETRIRDAEAVDVTYPGFVEALAGLGADVSLSET